MKEVTLTKDMVEKVGALCSVRDATMAGMDVLKYHKGILNYATALDLRERWIAAGHPSRFNYLKRLVSKLCTFGAIPANPVSGIPNPIITKRQRPEITHEMWMKLVKQSEGHWMHPIVLGIWMTGLAFSDVCTLEWKDVDVDAGVITKVREKMKSRTEVKCIIPLDPDGPYLAWLRAAHASKDLELGVYPSVNGRHYVSNEVAGRYLRGKTDHGIYEQWKKLLGKAGLGRIQIHDFRAHTATVLVNALNPILAAQVTGHKSMNILAGYVRKDVKSLTKQVREAHKTINTQPA